jgi:hypothetical protein
LSPPRTPRYEGDSVPRFVADLAERLVADHQTDAHVIAPHEGGLARRDLLRGVGFKEVKVSYLSHYLRTLSWVHAFSSVPIVGKYLKARLFIECIA